MDIIEVSKHNVGLAVELMHQYVKNMELKGEFTIRGAIERIVYQAKMQNIIQHADGIQEGLNEIARLPEFTTILRQEVKYRGLVLQDVESSIESLFQEVLVHPRPPSSNGTIVIREGEYNANQHVALIVFLKMQDRWHPYLRWTEGGNCKNLKVDKLYFDDDKECH
ncbi:hypothetical protein HOY80DRAFT_1107966 [Tuber brumale]|nr:hypothetical protein HOY80DRAFT_1107966 [Tuber brumale]